MVTLNIPKMETASFNVTPKLFAVILSRTSFGTYKRDGSPHQ
jgi:hypothetical protein